MVGIHYRAGIRDSMWFLCNSNLGGHPEVTNIGYEEGFKGCISQLKINGQNIDIIPGDEFLTCDSCDSSVMCDNGGVCQEANLPGIQRYLHCSRWTIFSDAQLALLSWGICHKNQSL